MNPPPISDSDAELVRLALQGQSEAFGELYNRYFPAAYDFLYRMMRNTEDAADVAQETFLRAMQNLHGLQNPSRFKSWLFTIAHHQALNRLQQQKRFVTPSGASEPEENGGESDPLLRQVDSDRLANPEQAAEANEVADLVWQAAESLDPRTYAVLDLHVRQELESAEIAEVLGVSKGNAYTILNRMKKSVEEAIGAFLMARRGSEDCQELQRILAPFDVPPVTPEVRRVIERHVRRCDICSRTRRQLLTPLQVLGALAAVPAPLGLQDQIWGALETRWAEAAALPSPAEGAGEPPDRGGTPGGPFGWSRWPWSRRRLALALAAAAILVLVPVLVVLFLTGPGADESSPPLVPTMTEPPATDTPAPFDTPTPSATTTPADTPTPIVIATQTPVPTDVPTQTPSPTDAATRTPLPTETAAKTPPPTRTPTAMPATTATPPILSRPP